MSGNPAERKSILVPGIAVRIWEWYDGLNMLDPWGVALSGGVGLWEWAWPCGSGRGFEEVHHYGDGI